jgi:3-hydroxyacyl-CoA dehydrogenase
MGGGIAALVASMGIPVVLLDIAADGDDPNATVNALWAKQRKATNAAPVTLGNTTHNFDLLRGCDWIVEAVIEQLEPKQQLMARLEAVRAPHAIISSNTSGIPISQIGARCSAAFQQHFLGTHFFNPPRLLKLLELIPTAHTAPAVTHFMQAFGTQRLGKGVVICNDTPGFIGNRIFAYAMQVRMRAALALGLSVAQVDALTGPLIGNPKTATFRLMDLVGLDVLLNVVRNQHAALLHDECRAEFEPSAVLQHLVAERKLGNKSGAGFYQIDSSGHSQAFNLQSWRYEPMPLHTSPLLAETASIANLPARLRAIFARTDTEAQYLINTTLQILAYAARRIPEVANSFADIDNAMRWGFNVALGPFEMWDALGLSATRAMMQARNIAVPTWVDDVLARGHTHFYSN